MHRAFNAFERHYRRTRYEVLEPMMRTGTFGVRAKWTEGEGFDARVLTPDSELTTRFMVLMYRFLNPSESIYYRKVWELLTCEFADQLPPNAIEAFDNLEAALASGCGIRFKFNDQELSAEQIYRTVALGSVFARQAEAQQRLKAIAQIPFADELFLYQFYDYSMATFHIVSMIFDLIRDLEQTDVFKSRYGDPDPSSYHCIFCRTTKGTFKSEEHVIPESLGPTDWVLPKGYVCDSCNNGPLAKLDNALARSPLLAYQRLLFVPYDKEGRFPESRLGSTTWKKSGPLDIRITADPGSEAIKLEEELKDGWKRFSIHETLEEKFDGRMLARALCKIALEIIAADHGIDFACQDRYDAARKFVLKGGNFRSYFSMGTEFTPVPLIRIFYQPLPQGTFFGFDIYGLRFLLNIEESTTWSKDDLHRSNSVSFSLFGKSTAIPFTVNMVPNREMLGNLPHEYWPEIAEINSDNSDNMSIDKSDETAQSRLSTSLEPSTTK